MKKITNKTKIFLLYSHCIVVHGYLRSVVYDLHFERIHPWFRQEFENLIENRYFILDDLKSNNKIMYEYLISNDLGFEIDYEKIKFFPKLDLSFHSYSDINSINIVASRKNFENIQQFKEIINKNLVYHILITFNTNDILDLNFIENYVKSINIGTHLNSINISCETDIENTIVEKINLIPFVNFVSSNFKTRFFLNQYFFIEAVNINPYFFRKLFINEHGLYSCDGVQYSKNLNFVLAELFKNKLGDIKKDNVDICNQCEFRYSCFDKRTPVVRSSTQFYYEDECTYNPFIARFCDEDGFLNLEECGVYSCSDKLVMDIPRIKKINTSLWEKQTN
jgi:hypothetical protein